MGDGARAYQTLPRGTKALSQFYIGTRGNVTPTEGTVIRGADIDMNLGISQYSQTFGISGRQAGVMAYIPYGNVSGSLGLGGGGRTGSASGTGDLTLGVAFGLWGTPDLAFEDYATFDPGLAIVALAKLTLPTGSYDSGKSLNLGGNRWALELGMPITYYVGTSYLDPALMTFEVLPKVTFFGDNDDAVGAANVLEQDPLFTLEAHVTRNFGRAFWASVDALYSYGGETTTDGVAGNNKQRSLSLGITGNLTLSRSMSAKLTYGEVFSGNADGTDGRAVRAQLLYLF